MKCKHADVCEYGVLFVFTNTCTDFTDPQFMSQGLFADVWTSCADSHLGVGCIIKNDGFEAANVHVSITAVHLTTGETSSVFEDVVKLPAGPGVARAFSPGAAWKTGVDDKEHVFTAVVTTAAATNSTGGKSVKTLSSHVILPAVPSALKVAATKITASVGARVTTCGDKQCVPITLTAFPAPALYVTLTSSSQGRFSENAVLVYKPSTFNAAPANQSSVASNQFERTVHFYPFDGADGAALFDMAAFKSTLRVEDVSMYLS